MGLRPDRITTTPTAPPEDETTSGPKAGEFALKADEPIEQKTQVSDIDKYADSMKDRQIRELQKQLEERNKQVEEAVITTTGSGGGSLTGGSNNQTKPNKIMEMVEKHKKTLVIIGVCIGLAYVGYRIWKAKNK